MKVRQEVCFYNSVHCHQCGYFCGGAYTPDLLNGPMEFKCEKCGAKFGYAALPEAKDAIRKKISLAEEKDRCYARIGEINQELGVSL